MKMSTLRQKNGGSSYYGDNEKCELRLLIDTNWAVAITANKKELSQKYNAVFNVLDRTTPECVLSIHCPYSAIDYCVADIQSKMHSLKTYGQKCANDMLVLIQRTHAQALTINGNRELEKLFEKTQCSIKVASECCPASNEHICRVIGTSLRLSYGIKQLVDFMRHNPAKEPRQAYDPRNYNREVAYGGFGCKKPMTPFGASMPLPMIQQLQPAQQQRILPVPSTQPPVPVLAQQQHQLLPPPPPPPLPLSTVIVPIDCCYDEPSSTTADHQQQILQNNNGKDTQYNQRELDMLKQQLAEAEQSRKLAEQSRDRAENSRDALQCEVDQLARQLTAMRWAQNHVNEILAVERTKVQNLNTLLAYERAKVQKLAPEREALEKRNSALIKEAVAIGEQYKQLRLANTQLQVEIDCLRRSRQNAENGENCNKTFTDAQLQKVQMERDALVEQSLGREAQMLALSRQLQAMNQQNEELKQAKEERDWMMANKDELIAVELEKFKGQMQKANGTTTTTIDIAVNHKDDNDLRSQVEKLKEALQSAEAALERSESNQQTARQYRNMTLSKSLQ